MSESDARPLVLLNSLGTTNALWDDVAPLLAKSFDVVRFDQRGHGTAAAAPPATRLDDLVDDLFDVLDRLDVEFAHLAGISIGGMIALRAASREPDRVLSLTAMCCAAVLDRQSWLERAATVRERGLEPIVPAVMARWFTPEFRGRRPDVVRTYEDMLRSTPPEGYAMGCDVLADADVRGDLAAIKAPTLVIGGAADPATPPPEQRAIAGAIAHARLEILPDVGHLAPVAAPETVAKLVLDNAKRSA
ncbi:alpha/beta fold hydrolase [Amycolatopsis sp. NPDC021455]|uniref:alpha/beta fold hydrolase n=1 Tax=Amycolatopsis sp. NPDC021455 TaxID=3154901 RepID=UPI0033CE1F2F